jgi:hypothetical protein
MNWVVFWKAVLIFTLIGYSILAVIVFFGGIRNVADMLRELRAPLDERDPD